MEVFLPFDKSEVVAQVINTLVMNLIVGRDQYGPEPTRESALDELTATQSAYDYLDRYIPDFSRSEFDQALQTEVERLEICLFSPGEELGLPSECQLNDEYVPDDAEDDQDEAPFQILED